MAGIDPGTSELMLKAACLSTHGHRCADITCIQLAATQKILVNLIFAYEANIQICLFPRYSVQQMADIVLYVHT